MELYEAIFARRMTRHFLADPIEPASLDRILRATLRAPSAGLSEGVELLVLSDEQRRRCFWQAASSPDWREHNATGDGVMQAPVIVLPLYDPLRYVSRYQQDDKASSFLHGRSIEQWAVPYWTVDAAFCAMLLLLAGENEGLGALFFHLQGNERRVLKALQVPDRFASIGAIALGRRARQKSGRPRATRPPATRIHLERFDQSDATSSD